MSDTALATALVEQYEIGRVVYSKHTCDTCHEASGLGNPKNPPVVGPGALPRTPPAKAKIRRTTFVTAADVVAFVRAEMPIDKPGTLTDAEAYAVVAWMLDQSKVPLSRPLDATTAPTISPTAP